MEIKSKSIAGKVAIVTKRPKALARRLPNAMDAEGAKVVVVDINATDAQAVADGIVAAGGTAIAVATDIAEEAAVDALFAKTVGTYGTVDILMNNAGLVSPMKHVLTVDKAWWDRIVSVNLTGTFLCCLKAAQIMAKNGGGAIINMSSGGATRAHRMFVAYDATKGGIEAMSRALALDLGPYGIRVNILTPGSIDTSGLDAESRRMRGVNLPLERIGEPDDMVGAAVFLASDDARYITGQSIVVDGGMLAQQRSATVDICPPSDFPKLEDL
ncbi:MAG: SDR family NAD(P)-dependent oxidoreductase [Caldilineaceae bacterium]